MEALFDWEALAGLLVDEGKKATGRPGYPVQTLLRALLLGIWHGLSDEQLAAQLARISCSASSAGWGSMPRPRMRPRSAASGSTGDGGAARGTVRAVTEQLAAKKVIIGEGRVAIIDATVVEAARTGRGKLGEGETDGRDPEAGAHVKINARGRKVGTWGYQFQVNADEDGFIHAQTVTPGNAHEIRS